MKLYHNLHKLCVYHFPEIERKTKFIKTKKENLILLSRKNRQKFDKILITWQLLIIYIFTVKLTINTLKMIPKIP